MDCDEMVACYCVRVDVPLSSWTEPLLSLDKVLLLGTLEKNAINMNANCHSKVSVGVQKVKLETNFLRVKVKAYSNSYSVTILTCGY